MSRSRSRARQICEKAEVEVSSAIFVGILNIVDDHDSTEQCLNLVEPDIALSFSFTIYGTSNLIQNAYFD